MKNGTKEAKEKTEKKEKSESSVRPEVSYWWYLPQIGCTALMTGAAVLIAFLRSFSELEIFQAGCFALLGGAVFGFAVRRYYTFFPLDPEYSERGLKRFYLVYLGCLMLALLCAFLPNTSWPFVAIFVLLGVFGVPMLGLLGGSVLLLVTLLLAGGDAPVFFLYFISGAFGLICFLPIREDFRFAQPLCLSMACLLVCETLGVVLTVNAALAPEQFLLPAVNLVLTSILIFAGVRYYTSRDVFRYQDLYQSLNDSEHPKLLELREIDRKAYKQSIHTAYFCDRIGTALGMDCDILKCAAYYHKLCPARREEREGFYDEMGFPGAVREVLDEFEDYLLRVKGTSLIRRETAVLLAVQTIISAVLALYEKDPLAELDINRLVDVAFSRFDANNAFVRCEISIRDLREMKAILKGDRLYYDFLR